jgi:hypothetical protein
MRLIFGGHGGAYLPFLVRIIAAYPYVTSPEEDQNKQRTLRAIEKEFGRKLVSVLVSVGFVIWCVWPHSRSQNDTH